MVGSALSRSAWGGGFALVGLRWVWVFAKAHQLEDLFMEPWVEAHVEAEVRSGFVHRDLGFFFSFLFNSLVLKLWNLTLFGC